MMKLARFMSLAGIASRRKSEDLIRQGLVQVNGGVVDRPEERVSPGDEVVYNGRPVALPVNYVYLLLNKPPGVLTTLRDPRGRSTVADYIREIKTRVYPVGRLDKDTSGLLLLTNDGELAHRLQHPRYQVKKTYRVTVKGIPAREDIESLESGVELEEGRTAPAEVKVVKIIKKRGEAVLDLTIHQGWKRQVRRMCRKLGWKVLRLKRTRLSFLDLEGVPEGSYRYLSGEEVNRLKKAAGDV